MKKNALNRTLNSFAIVVVALLLATSITGCTSSEMKNDEDGEEAPNTEAPTDAVPLDSTEVMPENSEQVEPPLADATNTPSADQPMTAPSETVSNFSGSGTSSATASYTVQSGDTLMKIAFERYGDLFQWRRIQEMNREKVSDPNKLATGTVLTLEDKEGVAVSKSGEKYLIKTGDTLGTISQDVYGSKKKWKRLWESNRQLITDPNKIFAGFTLYYPFSGEDEQFKQKAPTAPLAQPLTQKEVAPENRDPASAEPQPKKRRHIAADGQAPSAPSAPSAMNKWLRKK